MRLFKRRKIQGSPRILRSKVQGSKSKEVRPQEVRPQIQNSKHLPISPPSKGIAGKETTDSRGNKLRTLIIFLLGILCIGYLISGGRHFIQNRVEMRQIKLNEVRVEVLNGTDIKGFAENGAYFLRNKGLDVIRYGNSDNKVEETVIIDRADRGLKYARLVRGVLKQGTLTYEPHSLQLLEVTVVLGTDFKLKKESSILESK